MQQKNSNQENISLKPIIIGVFLILIVIIFFFSKNFLFKDNEISSSDMQQESTKKEMSVPMILPEDLQKIITKNNYQIIDIRSANEFQYSHIENSKNIPIDTLKDESLKMSKNKPIIIVDQTETKQGKEATRYLNNLNFSAKYLVGGIENFSKKGYAVVSFGDPDSITDIAKVNPLSPEEANKKAVENYESIKFLDVRQKSQFEEYHIENSINIPLEEIEKRKDEIPLNRLIIVDENSTRSFQAAVRLHDMNFIGIYCLKTSLSDLIKYIERENNNSNSDSGSESNTKNPQ